MNHHIFILNDYSNKPIDESVMRAKAETLFDDGVEFAHIGGVDDYKDVIHRAGDSGEQVRIYACGGDGTLHSVLQEVIGYDNLSLTNFASGTGNDYLKRFDDPKEFKRLESFVHVNESRVDVIKLNGSYSANVVCFGLDARVCDIYERLRSIRLIGKVGYQIGCLVNIINGTSRRCRVELDDGTVLDEKLALVCVCNNGWYGGSYHPAPEANVKDGFLDVIICKDISRLTMVRILPKYKRGDRNKISSRFVEYHRVRSLRIVPDRSSSFNLDGEAIVASDASLEVLHSKLRFFYPSTVKEMDP